MLNLSCLINSYSCPLLCQRCVLSHIFLLNIAICSSCSITCKVLLPLCINGTSFTCDFEIPTFVKTSFTFTLAITGICRSTSMLICSFGWGTFCTIIICLGNLAYTCSLCKDLPTFKEFEIANVIPCCSSTSHQWLDIIICFTSLVCLTVSVS